MNGHFLSKENRDTMVEEGLSILLGSSICLWCFFIFQRHIMDNYEKMDSKNEPDILKS